MIMMIFRSKRQEVTEGWRKLHNKELHILYSYYYVNKSRRAGGCSTHLVVEKFIGLDREN
jgi:hypothetical protein